MSREAAVTPGQGRDSKEFALYIQSADIRQFVQMPNRAKKDGYLYGLLPMIHPRYCFLGISQVIQSGARFRRRGHSLGKGASTW
jgi:hypothetical protein